ncbi:DUF4142 domain-containing protein [Mariniflexile soesokkakense]|uniref:DUF4142 domain-containing protein n=1 Tax=Mariniflexile soesokkakense TaxID=1343160 RepID=A0ABV0A8G7_9FLAO
MLSLIITVCVSFTFCDFKKEESQNKLYNNEAVYVRVKTNIEEAKVLSDISMLNETIIALSSLSLEKSSVYGIKTISNKLKKDNMEIRRSLNELAEKKLILLPIRLDEKEINELSKIDDTSFSKVYLNKVKELLESEITELEYLSTITNDLDFRVLTVKALVKLNYNLYQTHKTLK